MNGVMSTAKIITKADIYAKEWHFPVGKNLAIYVNEKAPPYLEKTKLKDTDIPIISDDNALESFTGVLVSAYKIDTIIMTRVKNGKKAFSEKLPTIYYHYDNPAVSIGSSITKNSISLYRYTWVKLKNKFGDPDYLTHRKTGPAILEYFNGERHLSQWWFKDKFIGDIETFCEQSGIDIKNLSEQDRHILKMKFEFDIP